MAKILIVDDEKSIRLSFASILEDAGYEICTAEEKLGAMAKLSKGDFEVALIDRLLRYENGMDLVEYVNRNHPFCTTVMMSAYPSFQSASEGYKHNLFAYLEKPVKREELCETVSGAVKNSMEKREMFYELKMIGRPF